MLQLDHYRMRVQYHGLDGLSEVGFKKRDPAMEDLFPTADRLILAMKAYFHKLSGSASIMYEVPEGRFEVVEEHRVLEVAVPHPRGEYIGMIIDILGLDFESAKLMLEDIEKTCGFVRAKFGEVMGVLELSEDDYVRRLHDSMKLLAHELHR